MKRGCLLRSIIYIVFIAGVIVYLVEKYGIPVYESSKQKIEEVFLEQLQTQILDNAASNLADSLKTVLSGKVKNIRMDDELLDTNKINRLVGDIKNYIETHSDEIGDINKLKEIISEYEQRKKD